MKRFCLHLMVAALPVAVAAMAILPLDAATPGSQDQVVTLEQKEAMLAHMKGMEELGKSLRRSVRKVETHGQALEEVAEYQRLTVLSKSIPPPMLTTIPEADRAAFLRDYRKGMVEVLVELCHLESALLDGNGQEAQDRLKVLKELEAAGHEQFMPDEG